MTAGRWPLVVVLGASGFIGSALKDVLSRRQIRLWLVGRRPTPPPVDPVAQVTVLTTDLLEPGAMTRLVAGADVVIYLVAYTKGGWRVADGDLDAERVNVGLVRDLVAALRTRRRTDPLPAVLYAGSGLTLTDRLRGPEPQRPRSAYCHQKLLAEQLLEEATVDGVARAVSLRLPAAYGVGPAADPRVVEIMIRQALAGQPLTLWHDGTVRRDFAYLDDIASAFVAAMDHVDALAGRYWLIGTDDAPPLHTVFTMISELVAAYTGKPPVPVVTVPAPDRAVATDLANLEVDSSGFRTLTGWRPVVPLREGLMRTVAALAGPREPDLPVRPDRSAAVTH